MSSLQLDVFRSKAGFAGRSLKMNTPRFATHAHKTEGSCQVSQYVDAQEHNSVRNLRTREGLYAAKHRSGLGQPMLDGGTGGLG